MDALIQFLTTQGPGPIMALLIMFFIALSLYCMHYVFTDMKEKRSKEVEDQKSIQKMAADFHAIRNAMDTDRSIHQQMRDDVKQMKEEMKKTHRDIYDRVVRLETITDFKGFFGKQSEM